MSTIAGLSVLGVVYWLGLYMWNECDKATAKREAYEQRRIDYYNKTGYWI